MVLSSMKSQFYKSFLQQLALKVGMELIECFAARCCSSSTSTLQNRTSSYSFAIFSKVGLKLMHGPHHVANQSTTTSCPVDCSLSRSVSERISWTWPCAPPGGTFMHWLTAPCNWFSDVGLNGPAFITPRQQRQQGNYWNQTYTAL